MGGIASQTAATISGHTRLYGIMGYPVAHSLSPLMQTTAFHHQGLDCLYVAFPVAPAHLERAVAGAVALGVCGVNVTIPHKEAIIPLLDEISPEAQFVGAVNTVLIRDGHTVGYNTDGQGFLQPLQAAGVGIRELPTLVLGAGGAARAITMALLQAGCPALTIANRTYARAGRLRAALRERFPGVHIEAVAFETAESAARRQQLIVNATSVGLHDGGDALLPEGCFGAHMVVYDIVYRPLYTPLLQAAQRRGAMVITGIEMLIGQGAAAFQLWTGRPFPVAVVRRALQPFLETRS